MATFKVKIVSQILFVIALHSSLQLQASDSNVKSSIQSQTNVQAVPTIADLDARTTIHRDNVNKRLGIRYEFGIRYANNKKIISIHCGGYTPVELHDQSGFRIVGPTTGYRIESDYEQNSLSVHEVHQLHAVRSVVTDTINPILEGVLDDKMRAQAELATTKERLDESLDLNRILQRKLLMTRVQLAAAKQKLDQDKK